LERVKQFNDISMSKLGYQPQQLETRDFSASKLSDLLWGLASLLFGGYRLLFPGVKLAATFAPHLPQFHPLPMLRMSGAIPLLPYMPFWYGQGQLYL
jgi:hypothetical protein